MPRASERAPHGSCPPVIPLRRKQIGRILPHPGDGQPGKVSRQVELSQTEVAVETDIIPCGTVIPKNITASLEFQFRRQTAKFELLSGFWQSCFTLTGIRIQTRPASSR